MPKGDRPTSCNDLLRISPEEYARLVDAAHAASPLAPGDGVSRPARLSFTTDETIIAAFRPSASNDITAFKVRPMNLSTTGMAFMHGSFVYTGTACSLIVRDVEGLPCQLNGNVVRCRLISGRAHEIGVQFTEAIDVSRFIEGAHPGTEDVSDAPEDRPGKRDERDGHAEAA